MLKGIDIHAHAFPDAIVARAMATLQEDCPWLAQGCGSIAGLKQAMAANNIEKSAVCGIATKPGQWQGILDWITNVLAVEDCFIPFASLHPDDENHYEILATIKAAGVNAIKFHPMYQNFLMDEQRMNPLYEAAESLGMLIAIHCGRDLGYPEDIKLNQAGPGRLINVVEKFSGLKILCLHMGGFLMWDDVEKYLVGSRVYFETSFSLTHMKPEQFIRIVKNHGDDKICFGSDWPWIDQGNMWREILACDLGEQANDNIFRHNAVRLLEIES